MTAGNRSGEGGPAFGEWQPIETAPKDGTWFMICREGEQHSREIGCFRPYMMNEYVPVGGGLYRKIEEPVTQWGGFNNFHRATHWTPCPPLPAPPIGGGGR